MTGKDIFENYKSLVNERNMLEMQIKSFVGISDEDIISSMAFSHQSDDVRVQTSGTSDKTCLIALAYSERVNRENDEWHSWLVKQYIKLDEEISFFDKCVEMIDGKQKRIIRALLDGDTWDSVCYNYSIARSTLSKYRKDAIELIQEHMDYRDKKLLNYMLYA